VAAGEEQRPTMTRTMMTILLQLLDLPRDGGDGSGPLLESDIHPSRL